MKLNKSITIIDFGYYTYVAKAMTRFFDKVNYYNQWSKAFPDIGCQKIGTGIDGVDKVLSWEEVYDDTDVFLFADIYFAPLANKMLMDGKKVFGSGDMEFIERDRSLFHKKLEESGLPVPPTEEIKGLDKLVSYLKGKKDLWIKISEYRGLCETWHYIDDRFSEWLINDIKRKLGPFYKDMVFLVQQPIETLIEYGSDGYVVNGKFPPASYFGFEQKGLSYFCKYATDLPKGLKGVHDKFEDVLESVDYTGFYSDEIRVTDKKEDLFIDVCPRGGQPPSALYLYMGENWGDVIWGGANGKMVELKSRFKYGAELRLHGDNKLWNPIYIDDKYKENLMLVQYCEKDGVSYRVPDDQTLDSTNVIGSLVAGGDTLDEAFKNIDEMSKTVQAYGLEMENTLEESAGKILPELKKITNYTF